MLSVFSAVQLLCSLISESTNLVVIPMEVNRNSNRESMMMKRYQKRNLRKANIIKRYAKISVYLIIIANHNENLHNYKYIQYLYN